MADDATLDAARPRDRWSAAPLGSLRVEPAGCSAGLRGPMTARMSVDRQHRRHGRPRTARRPPPQQAGDAAETLVAARLPDGRLDRPGPERRMSVATSSTSWRSTRARRRALVVVEVRWRAAGTSACPRRRSTTASGRGPRGRVRPARPGALPDGCRVPRLPLRFDLVVVEPAGRLRQGSPRSATTRAAP